MAGRVESSAQSAGASPASHTAWMTSTSPPRRLPAAKDSAGARHLAAPAYPLRAGGGTGTMGAMANVESCWSAARPTATGGGGAGPLRPPAAHLLISRAEDWPTATVYEIETAVEPEGWTTAARRGPLTGVTASAPAVVTAAAVHAAPVHSTLGEPRPVSALSGPGSRAGRDPAVERLQQRSQRVRGALGLLADLGHPPASSARPLLPLVPEPVDLGQQRPLDLPLHAA